MIYLDKLNEQNTRTTEEAKQLISAMVTDKENLEFDVPTNPFSPYDMGATYHGKEWVIEIKERTKHHPQPIIDVYKINNLFKYEGKCKRLLVLDTEGAWMFNVDKIQWQNVPKGERWVFNSTIHDITKYEPKEFYIMEWNMGKRIGDRLK